MKNKILLLALVSASSLLNCGCTKNFETINKDPNSILGNLESFKYLLTTAQLTTSGNSDANSYEDWRANLIYASCMVQHISSTAGYWEGDKYFVNSSYLSSYWDQNYGPQQNGDNPLQNTNSSPIGDIVEVVTHAKTDTGNVNLYNIARIFKVFMFQRMTDMYGDCPYSQAGLGYISDITAPKYDKQQDIYTDMFNELSDAASKLIPDPYANKAGSADLIYKGDAGQWKKFAYSEMLRLAMRISKVDPTNAQKWAQAAVAGGVFTDNTDNAMVQHQNATPNGAGAQVANGTGAVLGIIDPANARLSKTFVDYLRSTNDPRLIYYGTVVLSDPAKNTSDMGDTTAAHVLGQPNGYDALGGALDISLAANYPRLPKITTSDSTTVYQRRYSIVNRYTFARTTVPTFFLTYAETALLEAEAAQRGWIAGSAADFFTKGVQAAMQQLGLQAGAGPVDGLITTYLNAHPLVAGTELEQINTQYWIATFSDEYEAWANWRRSGFPTLTPINYPGNATNGTIPRRYTYPTGEAGTNSANYAAAVAGLSDGDKITSRVWWDK
jgi:hypothetical protein